MEKELSLNVPFQRESMDSKNITGLEEISEGNLSMKDVRRCGVALRADSIRKSANLPSVKEINDAVKMVEDVKDETIFEVQIGESNFLPACFLELGAKVSRAICKIEAEGVNYKGKSGSWEGTGFMVSENILLTNHHVLNSLDVARNATCIFNFQQDENEKMQPTKRFQINPDRLFLTSPIANNGLDFTFVWVDQEPGDEFGFININRDYFKVFVNEVANIIQHPKGNPKSIVLQENKILSQDTTLIHYSSDTEPGSSGAAVFNNAWKLTALHHASKKSSGQGAEADFEFVNEGIKLSAIAVYLENLLQDINLANVARTILSLFNGRDSALGFFGSLGRNEEISIDNIGHETIVNSYKGEDKDLDVAFWNIEWFTKHPEKVEPVAEVIADMNLDIWAFSESAPEVTKKLVEHLKDKYKLDYGWESSEPNAPAGKQTTTVIWNKKTVEGKKEKWADEIEPWFNVKSQDFDELGLEAVEGKVFDRYPGLFYFSSKPNQGNNKIDFYLVPLHLKAMAEGSKRRRMAAQILGAAVHKMIGNGSDVDWVLGGDFNAELATQDFEKLSQSKMVPISAEDENNGAFSYIKGPKSLIDHIFLSANLAKTYNSKDYFILAKEKTIPNYLKNLSDHRPVLIRMSLGAGGLEVKTEAEVKTSIPHDLKSILDTLK